MIKRFISNKFTVIINYILRFKVSTTLSTRLS
jgi:hypothetical protein